MQAPQLIQVSVINTAISNSFLKFNHPYYITTFLKNI